VAVYEIAARAGRYSTLVWNVVEYIGLFVIITLHEFGHAFASRSVGGRAHRILLWPFVGIAFVDPPTRAGRDLVEHRRRPAGQRRTLARLRKRGAARAVRPVPRRARVAAIADADQHRVARVQSAPSLSARRGTDPGLAALVHHRSRPQPRRDRRDRAGGHGGHRVAGVALVFAVAWLDCALRRAVLPRESPVRAIAEIAGRGTHATSFRVPVVSGAAARRFVLDLRGLWRRIRRVRSRRGRQHRRPRTLW
jgi:hypothetical protein